MQGNGTAASPYLVATAADLDGIRHLPADAHYRQVADINLGGSQWMPISFGSDGFMGVYDGDGHKITGLHVYTESSDDVGLFGALQRNPLQTVEVKNLTIKGKLAATNGGLLAGIVVGYYSNDNPLIITNCHLSGEIDCLGGGYIGGIYGWNYSAPNATILIDNCTAYINVKTSYNAAGGYIGGLVGNLRGSETGEVKVSNCAAYGTITVPSTESAFGYRGGLVGCVQVDTSHIVNSEAHVDIIGGYEIGGLVGAIQGDTIISGCCATGNVIGYGRCGGLIGTLGASSSKGSTAQNCYSTGSVSAPADYNGYFYGGFCGAISYDCAVENCFAAGNINARNGVAGLCGYNSGAIQSSFALSKAIVDIAPDYYLAGRVASGQWGTINAYARSDMTYNGVVGGFPRFDPTLGGKDGQSITPAQAKMRATYAATGWDMSEIWDIVEGHTYPYLRSERNKIWVKQGGAIHRVHTPYAKVGDAALPCLTYTKQNGQIYQI